MKRFRHWLFLAASFASLTAWGYEQQLSSSDVTEIIQQATARAAQVDAHAVIAVVDREGYILGVWAVDGKQPNVEIIAGAISRAFTVACLSSNQNAFTTRTAGYIIQQHFPPGVRETGPGPLVGIGISSVYLGPDTIVVGASKGGFTTITVNETGHADTNFAKQIPTDQPVNTFDPNEARFAAINPFLRPKSDFPGLVGARSPGIYGAGIFTGPTPTVTVPNAAVPATVAALKAEITPGGGAPGTSLNDTNGGLPLYKDGQQVGGIGVTGAGQPINVSTGFAIIDSDIPKSEDPFEPSGQPSIQKDATPGFSTAPSRDEDVALAGQKGYEPDVSIRATQVYLGGIQIPYVNSTTSDAGRSSQGAAVTGYPIQKSPPEFNYPKLQLGGVSGELRFPIRADPTAGNIGKTRRLSAGEVQDIISNAAAQSAVTRTTVRHPSGPSKVWITIVGNPGAGSNTPPPIVGIFREDDAINDAYDVTPQKARTSYFFSNDDFAQSTRCVGFLGQRWYPPGIDGNSPGPYFGLQEALLIDQFLGVTGRYHSNPYLPDQINLFAGGFPLYRNGVLIGGIGSSGDGIDQDDIIGAAGTVNFEAPASIRSDQFLYMGARLPYAKFPRDPGP